MKLSYLIYVFSVFLLICVLLFEKQNTELSRGLTLEYLDFNQRNLQSLELFLALSKLLSKHDINVQKKRFDKIALIIGFPVLLIFLQPDMGSCLVFTFLIIPLFREA